MAMTNILLALPTVLTCAILCNWITVPDLARVDSAHCCTRTRKKFLALYSLEEFILEKPNPHQHGTYPWLMSRNLKICDFVLNEKEPMEAKMVYLQKNGRCVRSIKFSGTVTGDEAKLIAQCCANVKFLSINSDNESALELLRGFPGLQRLVMFLKCEISATQCQDIAHLNVTSLTVMGLDWTEKSFIAIVAICPAVQKLCLSHLSGDIERPRVWPIIEHCMHLCTLRCDFADDAALLAISQYTRIIHLDITHSHRCTDIGMVHVVSKLQLQSLLLPCNAGITNVTIHNLIKYCSTMLEVLCVHQTIHTPELTREAWDVDLLQRKCVNLHTFEWSTFCLADNSFNNSTHTARLSVQFAVTDHTLLQIAQCCKKVVHVNLFLDSCGDKPVFTSVGLRALVSGCAKLKSICIRSEVNISPFADFVRDFPGLCIRGFKYKPYDVMSVALK